MLFFCDPIQHLTNHQSSFQNTLLVLFFFIRRLEKALKEYFDQVMLKPKILNP